MVTPKKNDSAPKSAAAKAASTKSAPAASGKHVHSVASASGGRPASGHPAGSRPGSSRSTNGKAPSSPAAKSRSATPSLKLAGAKPAIGGAPAAPGAKAPKKLPKRAKTSTGRDIPNLFRLNLEVGDLDAATRFYERLLGIEARKQAGGRVYFSSGAVTLQVVQVPPERKPHPSADSLYFAVADIDAVYERAKALGCLSRETVHGRPGGEVHVRPWGERSFYARDRWKNPLCFVAAGTEYMG